MQPSSDEPSGVQTGAPRVLDDLGRSLTSQPAKPRVQSPDSHYKGLNDATFMLKRIYALILSGNVSILSPMLQPSSHRNVGAVFGNGGGDTGF